MFSSNVYFYKNGNKKCIKKREKPLITHFPLHFYEETAPVSSDTKKQDRAQVQQFVKKSAFQLTKSKRNSDSVNNCFPTNSAASTLTSKIFAGTFTFAFNSR